MTVTSQPSLQRATPGSPREPWDRRRDGRALLALFLIAVTVYLLTARYTIVQVNDTRATAISAWSLGTQGTLALPTEWPDDAIPWATSGVDGRTYTDRFPGPTLWAAPFYTVAELIRPRGTPAHPYLANFAPAGVAAAFAGALAMCAAFAVYRRLERRRVAMAVTVFLAFGTGMWSVAASAMWTHGIGSLFLLLGVLATSGRRYGWAGAAFGIAILCRPQYAAIPAIIGLWEGARHRDLRPVLKIGALSALGLAAMSVYSHQLFGTWLPVAGYSTHKVAAVATTGPLRFAENVTLGLVHPLRGILVYTPVLLFLLPGIDRGWKAAPPWVRSSAVAGVVYALVQLRANGWDGGAGHFGSRLMLETLVLASPMLLITAREYLAPASQRVRLAAGAVVVASIGLHTVGATVVQHGFMDDDGIDSWQQRMDELCTERPELCPAPEEG
jgi:hypothetical protein